MALLPHGHSFFAAPAGGVATWTEYGTPTVFTTATNTTWSNPAVFQSFGQLPAPAQQENALRADHPEVEWLRRRVSEITDLVAA